jgi:hydrogenase nickel incorporation protein HypA/HybF
MHEISLARGILEIIQQHVLEDDLPRVRSVTVRIGKVSGVVPESLEFAYQALVSDTALSSSSLRWELVPFQIHCNRCLETTQNDSGIAVCENCWSSDTTILSGNELDVMNIELVNPVEESQHEYHND